MFGLFEKHTDAESKEHEGKENSEYASGLNLLIMSLRGLVPEIQLVTEISRDEAMSMGGSEPPECIPDLTYLCVKHSKGKVPIILNSQYLCRASKLCFTVGILARSLREVLDE